MIPFFIILIMILEGCGPQEELATSSRHSSEHCYISSEDHRDFLERSRLAKKYYIMGISVNFIDLNKEQQSCG